MRHWWHSWGYSGSELSKQCCRIYFQGRLLNACPKSTDPKFLLLKVFHLTVNVSRTSLRTRCLTQWSLILLKYIPVTIKMKAWYSMLLLHSKTFILKVFFFLLNCKEKEEMLLSILSMCKMRTTL